MLRAQRLLTVTLAATTATITFGLGLSIPTASAAPVRPAAVAVYVVRSGDSLIGISSKLGVSLTALLDANKLARTSVIHPGQTLTVPATATNPPVTTPAPAPAPTSAPAPTAASRTYTVVSGDSLIGISNKLKVTLVALLETNKLVRTSVIRPGQVLQVPASASAPVAPPAAAAAAPVAASASTLHYVVQRNDFLLGIAAILGVSLQSLLSTNNLTASSVIHPGQKLVVPAGGRLPATTAPAPAPSSVATPGALDPRIAKVLEFARAQLGKPYRFGTAGPLTFDCSGLTLSAYKTIGISLPHYSVAQAERGTAINPATQAIKAGDLVFVKASGSAIITHVGIAISSTQWIHAPRTGDVVRIGTIPTSIAAVRRLVETA